MTDSKAPPASERQREPILRFFRQRYVATLVAARRLSLSNLARPEAGIFLALGDSALHVEAKGFSQDLQAVVVAPMVRHSISPANGPFISVVINPIHPRYPALAFMDKPVKALDPSHFAHLHTRLKATFSKDIGSYASAQLIEEVLDIVLQDSPPTQPVDPRITWIMRKLEDDIDHPFEKLADELGLSPSRLSHLFTEGLGLPFRSYQAWGRAVMAWELVALKPKMSLTRIAQIMGFTDSAHLSRKFLQTFALTPSQVRNPELVYVVDRFVTARVALAGQLDS